MPIKILIVDDDFANRKMMQQQLNRFGQTHLASNGKQALESFTTALKDNDPFDLICLDITMPVMDGHQTLFEIRRIEKLQRINTIKPVSASFK